MKIIETDNDNEDKTIALPIKGGFCIHKKQKRRVKCF